MAGLEVEPVDEAALHRLIRDWRRGRATRTLGEALMDAYIAVFAVVLLGSMILSVLLGSQADAAACTTDACLHARALVPWATWLGIGALALSASGLFGPVLASAAEGFWLLGAPLSRRRILRRRLWSALALGFALAAAFAAVVVGLAGLAPLSIAGWAVASGLTASALVAFAALEQSHDRTRPVRVLQGVLTALATAVVVLLVLVAAGMVALPSDPLPDAVAWGIAAAAGLATATLGVVAHHRLESFRTGRVTSGGSLVSGLQGAMFGLDLGLARDILVDREAIARGHVSPRRGSAGGVVALVQRDVQRLARDPRPLVGVVGAVLAPYATDALGLGQLTPLLAGLALLVALVPTLGSLRVLSRTRGLARTFPFSTAQLRLGTSAVPAVVALAWASATTPSFLGVAGGPARTPLEAVLTALAVAAAGLVGAVRWQSAKPVDFATPMLATAAGAVPPSLVTNLLRGIDLVTVVTAPLLLGAGPVWSLALAAVCVGVLLWWTDMESLQVRNEEVQRQLEAAKGARTPRG